MKPAPLFALVALVLPFGLAASMPVLGPAAGRRRDPSGIGPRSEGRAAGAPSC